MKKSINFLTYCLVFLCAHIVLAQAPKKIVIENADFQDVDEYKIPGAILLTRNVRVSHDGVVLTCNKAYFFRKENYLKAFGNVDSFVGKTTH